MNTFEKIVLQWFREHGRKRLPWRKKGITPYEVWVSEIMLQQTQVSRVLKYYKRFLKKFPTIEKLAQAPWEEFLPYYSGLGYYRRGHNMLKAAKIIDRLYKGKFPRDKQLLMKLPGIGEYTASAILSFGYGDAYLAFDINLKRVFGRFFSGNKNAQLDFEKIEKKLKGNRSELNSALMDFANLVCLHKPKCEICPLARQCRYFREKGKGEIQKGHARSLFPLKKAQVFLWLHKDHKEYYSPNPDRFEVFVFPPASNTREKIKEYFQKNYGLEVSVRPPHKKTSVNGISTIFVNAQILLGKHEFGVFSKEDIL